MKGFGKDGSKFTKGIDPKRHVRKRALDEAIDSYFDPSFACVKLFFSSRFSCSVAACKA